MSVFQTGQSLQLQNCGQGERAGGTVNSPMPSSLQVGMMLSCTGTVSCSQDLGDADVLTPPVPLTLIGGAQLLLPYR